VLPATLLPEPPAHLDLSLTAVLVRVASATYTTPRAQSELDASVVTVACVGAPVTATLASSQLVPTPSGVWVASTASTRLHSRRWTRGWRSGCGGRRDRCRRSRRYRRGGGRNRGRGRLDDLAHGPRLRRLLSSDGLTLASGRASSRSCGDRRTNEESDSSRLPASQSSHPPARHEDLEDVGRALCWGGRHERRSPSR
jgi:hypothetical protein